MNLEDYNKQVLEPIFKHCAEEEAKKLLAYREDYKYYEIWKPTRWQKFKFKLQDYHQRVKDIWTILKGDDVHKDCGY